MLALDHFPQFLIFAFETYVKRRSTFRYWKELEASQWRSREELDAIQITALRKLLTHAATCSPYYRNAWQELGLRVDHVVSVTDLGRWPVITKDTIRQNRQTMRSTCPTIKSFAKTTGGSSGTPLEFDVSSESNDRRVAAWHRGYTWAGAVPGTKQFYLWGVPTVDRPAWQQWKDWAYHRILYRHCIVNTFHLREENLAHFLAVYDRFRPKVLVAYTSPLYEFAKALKRRNARPFSPTSIVVGAEKLYDFQRQLIEEVFQAPVFETYGSREFMLIGAECDRHEGLHLTAENLLVEILDDAAQPTPAGEEGNVVITDLYNYATPFIRYANGDRATAGWAECTCGRGLPLLKKITGRTLDVLTTPDGRRIPGEFFVYLLKDYVTIERFQVQQEEPDLIRLRLVTNNHWREGDEKDTEREVRKVIGDAIRFVIEKVDEIPLTRSGKLQVVINRCQPPTQLLSPQ